VAEDSAPGARRHATVPGEAAERPLTVGLVDDDAIVRAWVRLSLEGSEFRVVGEAPSGATTSTMVEQRRPELLLVDYRLPDTRATDLVRSLRRAGWTIPALIITATPEAGLNEAALEAGAQGVVLKRGDPAELVAALRRIATGLPVLDPQHPRRPPDQSPLSPRERDVLRLAAAGSTNQEIARSLELGTESVKTLLSRAFLKLGARNRTEAATIAKERGLL
jgi:DNA-binding NarL/FixJ family response regulator